MNYLKILGSMMVIFSSSLIGFLIGHSYIERFENLIYMENCIKILETEIIYAANPLPLALEMVYRKGNKKVSFVFKKIEDILSESNNNNVIYSFEKTSDILIEKLKFSLEDVEVFMSLGRTLGVSDRNDQEKNIKLVMAQLKAQQDDAKQKKEKNEKLYKNLGLLTGIAIVIILI